jgi:hypothetical protein
MSPLPRGYDRATLAVLLGCGLRLGFSLSKAEVPAKLFQISTRRLNGHSAVALLSSFGLANITRLSCAAGSPS